MLTKTNNKMYKTQSDLLVSILRVIPYANQITEMDTTTFDGIYFTWRGDRFKVSLSGHIEQVKERMLSGSNISILLEALLKSDKNK